MKIFDDLEKRGYKYHHCAYCRGYVSVKNDGLDTPEPYKGRFGVGYTVKQHNPHSTIYCYINYFIKEA